MDDFIATCKAQYPEDNSKCLVVGDLDGEFGGTLAAISLAYYLQNRRYHIEGDTIDYYIPIIYTHRDVIDTKTDVFYYLEKFGLKSDNFLCLDDIHIDDFDELILVDYRPSAELIDIEDSMVKMIFCKMECELNFAARQNMERVFKQAETIATVIAHYITRSDPQNLTDDDKLSLKILYDCIVYFTNNCRCNTYPHDVKMLSDLEGYLGVPEDSYGESLLTGLHNAYDDFSNLNVLQMLYKFSAGYIKSGNKYVYIADIPIGIKELTEMPQFRTGIIELGEWVQCNVLVVVSRETDEQNNGKMYIAVININDSAVHKKVLDKFLYNSELLLCYRGAVPEITGKWYRNHNNDTTIEDIRNHVTDAIKP